MNAAAIEEFYRGNVELIEFLLANGQPSYASDATDNFRRFLVIAVASFFEAEISTIVRMLPAHHAKGNAFLVALVDIKAVSRQYHTYFEWDKPNANKFFSMFGADYKAACQKNFNEDVLFKSAVQAFLSLGATRNLIAHENYVQFNVDKTPEDIIKEFRQALGFVEYVRATLLPPKPPIPEEASTAPEPETKKDPASPGDIEASGV